MTFSKKSSAASLSSACHLALDIVWKCLILVPIRYHFGTSTKMILFFNTLLPCFSVIFFIWRKQTFSNAKCCQNTSRHTRTFDINQIKEKENKITGFGTWKRWFDRHVWVSAKESYWGLKTGKFVDKETTVMTKDIVKGDLCEEQCRNMTGQWVTDKRVTLCRRTEDIKHALQRTSVWKDRKLKA